MRLNRLIFFCSTLAFFSATWNEFHNFICLILFCFLFFFYHRVQIECEVSWKLDGIQQRNFHQRLDSSQAEGCRKQFKNRLSLGRLSEIRKKLWCWDDRLTERKNQKHSTAACSASRNISRSLRSWRGNFERTFEICQISDRNANTTTSS